MFARIRWNGKYSHLPISLTSEGGGGNPDKENTDTTKHM